jgi:uncharacterized protein
MPYLLPLVALLSVASAGPDRRAVGTDVPRLSGPVVDEVGLLDPAARRSIAEALAAYQRRSGNQLQVLIIDTLGDEPIEAYSMRVAEAWKLGSAERDNGVLLLIARADRRWRIEVGGGLEGELTDALASRMGRNILSPSFRDGRFAEGIAGTLQAVAAALGDELQFTGVQRAEPQRRRSSGRGIGLLLSVLVLFMLLGGRGGGLFSGLLLGSLLGSGFGGRHRGSWGGGSRGSWGGGGGGFSGGGASGGW